MKNRNTLLKLSELIIAEFTEGRIFLSALNDLIIPPFPPNTLDNVHSFVINLFSNRYRADGSPDWTWPEVSDLGILIGENLDAGLMDMYQRGELSSDIISGMKTRTHNADNVVVSRNFFPLIYAEQQRVLELTGAFNVPDSNLDKIATDIQVKINELVSDTLSDIDTNATYVPDEKMFKIF